MARKHLSVVTIIALAAALTWYTNQIAAQQTGSGETQSTQETAEQAADDDLFGSPAAPTQTPQAGQADTATQSQPQNQTQGQPSDTTTQPAAPQQQTDLDAANAQSQLRQQQQRDLLAGIQFGQATDRGLTVANLAAESFFVDSGLRAGDVIIAYKGQPIRSEEDFRRLVNFQQGQRVPLTVLRGGQQETLYISFPEDTAYSAAQTQPGQTEARRPEYGGPAFLGVGFDTQLYGAAAVRDVLPGSAAEQAGLREGDIIVALNGQPVDSFQEAMRLIRSMRAGDSLEIEYTRRIANRTQATLGTRPTSGPGAVSYRPGEVVEVYRGGPQFEEYYEAPPMEQPPDMPPPSPPPSEPVPNELP